MAAADSALRRERESFWIPAPSPAQRRIFPLPRRDPQAASAPFPRGSTSQPRATAARHLASLARTPRTVETGGSVHRGPRSPAPPGRDLVRGCGRGRGGTSLAPPTPRPLPPRSPFRPEAPGRQGRKGPEWSRCPASPSHGLAPGCERRPGYWPAGPGAHPWGGPGATAQRVGRGCRELPGRPRGRCLAGWSRGLLPSPRAQSPFGRDS